jgi:2-hydroxy-3-keto-5-methylthiopentenyl-1-phosphate phosphatase
MEVLRTSMGIAVLADFDRTVTDNDASYAVLDGFAKGDWRRIEDDALAGRYTIKEALTLQVEMVRGRREDVDRYVLEKVHLRKGFKEFAELCRVRGVHLEICSDGFGHTIPLLLERDGMDWIRWTSNDTWFERDRMRIAFNHTAPLCPVNANCKCSHHDRLMKEHGAVVFVGDGGTDACVAGSADILFARDWLADHCRDERIHFHPWKEWSDVWEFISGLL